MMLNQKGVILFLLIFWAFFLSPMVSGESVKRRIFVVSSYHKEYLWCQSTQNGLTDAMLNYGYLDTPLQAVEFTKNNEIESSKALIRKVWMDTKRKSSFHEMAYATDRIIKALYEFNPDLVLLGDDNAANYIGNQLLDTHIPVVFWGINGLPLKYGLVESMDSPGHNITGVWQIGYPKQGLELLVKLVPSAKTFAILACDSETSRPRVKQIRNLHGKGELPLKLVGEVVTDSFSEFKARVKELALIADVFFVLNHDTLKNDDGRHVDMLDVGKWYLENVNKPEVTPEPQFVLEGMLIAASDSGYIQSYKAFEMAYDILEQGLNPARMRTIAPHQGPLMVNAVRAKALGISLENMMDYIDEIVEKSLALER